MKRFPHLPPAVIALALQVAALALTIFLWRWLALSYSIFVFALVCGGLAAMLSRFVGLARWWLPMQLLFMPGLVGLWRLNIPSGVYLGIFLTMLLVYWSVFHTQVPLYLSSEKVWLELESLLPPATQGKIFHFVDLGCGVGGVLSHLARNRPDGIFHGVELAPLPCLLSWIRAAGKGNCRVRWGSLWDCDLGQYDVVFAYLSPVPMRQLWEKALTEMRPGSRFISSTFEVPGQSPEQIIQVDDLHHSRLLIWRM